MNSPRTVRLLLAAVVWASLSACGPTPASRATVLRVVTTVTQVSALARAVGGSRISLTALLKAGDDPHAYEPRSSDVGALAEAQVVIKSGAGLDHWIDRPISSAAPNALVVDASAGTSLRAGDGGVDPHWWYDLGNAEVAVDRIGAAMAAADPAHRQDYLDNAIAEKQRLVAADGEVRALINTVPAAKRLFVANHDAFNYFLSRYDITLVGDIIPSTDTLAAIRPADTAHLISEIKRLHVRAIFTETSLDPGLARQIAAETGARVFDGKLYGDSIGDPGSDGATLDGALLHNAAVMVAGFLS